MEDLPLDTACSLLGINSPVKTLFIQLHTSFQACNQFSILVYHLKG